MSRAILNTVVFAILVLIGLTVYRNSLQNGYHYDDSHHIVDNQYLTTLRNTPLFFTDSRTFTSLPEGRNHYRPLLLTTYALNYHFGKLRPGGYHLVNLGFHVGSAFLLFLIVQAMLTPAIIPFSPPLLKGFFAALAAGLIFLTTPFNSEVVNYISARSSVMCTFFYLLSFYCWVEFRSKKLEVRSQNSSYLLPLTSYSYFASLLAFLLAMLTKEIAITLPVMIFLYDIYFREKLYRTDLPPALRNFRFQIFYPHIPFGVVAIFTGFLLRKIVCGNILSIGEDVSRGPGTQLYTELRLVLKYIYMTLIPVGLSVEHPVRLSSSFLEPGVLISFIVVILILGILFLLFSSKDIRYRLISFFGAWFFITLLPTTLIPLNAMFQENRGYLQGAGIVVIAGIVLDQGIQSLRFSERFRVPLSYGLLIVLLLVYGGMTWNRNLVWKDDLTLWKDVEKKYPQSENVLTELARIRIAQDPALAKEELKNILEREPQNTSVMNNLGILYTREGKYDLAEDMFLKAISINAFDVTYHFNLAKVYKDRGDKELAVKEYQEVLRLAPDNIDAAELLVRLYKGETERIEEVFLRASREDPKNPAFHKGLGVAYAKQQRWNMAVESFRRVLEITPDDIQTRVDLGDSYIKLGRPDLAEMEFNLTLELDPGTRMAHQGLGIIYQQQERFDLALKHYEKAIEGRRGSPRVLNNIGAIYLAKGDTEKAIDAFKKALELDPSYDIVRTNLERAYKIQRGGKGR